MWEVLLLLSIIASPLFVVIEGRRTRKLEKQERFIRIERAIFIGLFITLALFMLTGVLGFFDFVSRFKEPLDKIVLFSPVNISILASIVIADLMREEVEGSTKTNLLRHSSSRRGWSSYSHWHSW